MIDTTVEEETIDVDAALASCKEYAGKTADQTLKFFIKNYFLPTLVEMRKEYQDLAIAPEADEDDEKFASMSIALVQELSTLLDAAFRAAGWMTAEEITDKMPVEIKEMYSSARVALAEFGAAADELYAPEDPDEGDGADEPDEEDESDEHALPPAAGGAA